MFEINAISLRYRCFRLIFVVFMMGLLSSCATRGYQQPERPPDLEPNGWPVGVWRSDRGNELILNKDGTAQSITNIKLYTIRNYSLTWRFQDNAIRIDRWIQKSSEAYFPENAPAKARSQIADHLARVQDHSYWILYPDNRGGTVLSGSHYYTDRYFSWNGVGELTKVDVKGLKTLSTNYKLVELTSVAERAERERREREADTSKKRLEEEVDKAKKETIGPERKTVPSEYEIKAKFNDESSIFPNNSLDAGEEALLHLKFISVGNTTNLPSQIDIRTDYKEVEIVPNTFSNNLLPYDKSEIAVKVIGGINIKQGTIPLIIAWKDIYGYTGKAIIEIEAKKIAKHNLFLHTFEINDGIQQPAIGNGNGVIESGETIEVICKVKNNGPDNASGIAFSAISQTNGVNIRASSERFKNIGAGETVSAKFILSLPRTFSDKDASFQLKALDSRGVSVDIKTVALKTRPVFPKLVCRYRVLDKKDARIDGNPKGFIECGDQGKIEVSVANQGDAEAEKVKIQIKSQSIVLESMEKDIGGLKPKAESDIQVFRFTIPRTLGTGTGELLLLVTHQDFGSLNETIKIPYRPFTP